MNERLITPDLTSKYSENEINKKLSDLICEQKIQREFKKLDPILVE